MENSENSTENAVFDEHFNLGAHVDGVFEIISTKVSVMFSQSLENIEIEQKIEVHKTKGGNNSWCAHLSGNQVSYRYFTTSGEEIPSKTVITPSGARYKIADLDRRIMQGDSYTFKTRAVERNAQFRGDTNRPRTKFFTFSRVFGRSFKDLTLSIHVPDGYAFISAIPYPTAQGRIITFRQPVEALIPITVALLFKQRAFPKLVLSSVNFTKKLVWTTINAAISATIGVLIGMRI